MRFARPLVAPFLILSACTGEVAGPEKVGLDSDTGVVETGTPVGSTVWMRLPGFRKWVPRCQT